MKAISQLGPRLFRPEGNGIGIHGTVLLHDSIRGNRFLWVAKIMSPDESVVYFEKFYEHQIFSIDDVVDNTVRFDDVIPVQNGDYKAAFTLVKIRPVRRARTSARSWRTPGISKPPPMVESTSARTDPKVGRLGPDPAYGLPRSVDRAVDEEPRRTPVSAHMPAGGPGSGATRFGTPNPCPRPRPRAVCGRLAHGKWGQAPGL